MPVGREYELKFSIEPRDVESLVSHPLVRSALPSRRLGYLMSTYFDTPESALRADRVSLRVRQSDAGITQTLKAAGVSRVDRQEWEIAGASVRPDEAWLRSTPLKSVFKSDDLVAALAPQFTVEVARTTFPLSFEGTQIEAAIDQGNIRAKGLSLPISEFELELKDGAADRVVAFARRLARDLPLKLSLASKAERGFAVLDLTWGKPSGAIAIGLDAEMSIGAAFEAVMQACLHALLVNAGLIGGRDEAEAVHKTRIASRRLRAALQLFRPVLDRRRYEELGTELRWMGRRLGDARDADVFQQTFFDRLADETGAVGAPILADLMRQSRADTYRRLRKALGSRRWRLAVLDILAASTEAVPTATRDDELRPFLRRRFKKQVRQLAGATTTIAAMPDVSLHDLRKQAKMLRYNFELVETTPKLGGGKKSVRRVKKHLHALQQTLGVVHDAQAMRERVRHLIQQPDVPSGLDPEDWQRAVGAGRLLLERPTDDEPQLRKAGEAAAALREAALS